MPERSLRRYPDDCSGRRSQTLTDDTDLVTGLAAAQWETGRLQDNVRDLALRLIANGGDAEEYGQPGRRRHALEQLARKLKRPMPPSRKLRPTLAGPDSGVEIGDMIHVWSTDRTSSALFLVFSMHEHRELRWPQIMGLFSERPNDLRSRDELASLPYLSAVDLSAFEYEQGVPDYMIDDLARELTIMVSRRTDRFTPTVGEIVARSVEWRGEPPVRHIVHAWFATWDTLIGDLDDDNYRFYDDATRRRLAGEHRRG